MTDDERLTVVKAVFVRGFNGAGYPPFAFPGFDRLGLALGIADEWVRAGHPDGRKPDRSSPLLEYVVCPYPADAKGQRFLAPRCDHDLYRYALASEPTTERLVDHLIALADPVFTETAIVAALYADRQDPLGAVLDLWRRVEPHEATWRVVARVIGDDMAETSDRPRLVDEVRRQWRAHPERRGLLLYVVARADPYDNGAIAWARFAEDYGALVSPAELAAYLDVGPAAMQRLGTAWPALGNGFSRSRVLVPRLDAFLAAPSAEAPHRALENIVRRLCAEGAEAPRLATVVADTARCATSAAGTR